VRDRTGSDAPGDRDPDGPAGDARRGQPDAPSVDLARRRFFRSFGREALQTAAQIVSAAAVLQRNSFAATSQLLSGSTDPDDPIGQLPGTEAAPSKPVPPATPFRSPYRYREGEVTLVDQRRLPGELVEVVCHTGPEIAASIRGGVVRGGPVLGQVAAYGVLLAAERTRASGEFIRAATLHGTINALRSARAASRIMEVALDRVLGAWQAVGETAPGDAVVDAIRAEAQAIADEAMLVHAAIGRAGAAVLPSPIDRRLEVLVHGPVGPLGGGMLGTAVAVLHELRVQGRDVHVWVPEERPSFHGARITAFELARFEIAHTVTSDAAVGSLIARGRVDAVLLGAERIARNGDLSAAIGTYPIAAVAARHDVPVYVTAPLRTLDAGAADGWQFAAEEGTVDELADVNGRRVPPGESLVFNPTLDVTPAALVRGFVTEAGVLAAPFEPTLAAALHGPGAAGPRRAAGRTRASGAGPGTAVSSRTAPD
jgi:methylthioribose-1-phosphate isomerase